MMSNQIILAVLELAAIVSCSYGMYFVYLSSGTSSILSLVYNGQWFILGSLSNLFGLIALYFFNFAAEDEIQQTGQYFVQHHYFFAWLTIVLGYPSFVTQQWMVHYPTYYNHIHLLLSIIPLCTWIYRKTQLIVYATQATTIAAIISHAYISYLVWNTWGMIGAGVMIINMLSLSMPTRYNIWGFSSRELYVIGLAGTSYIFCLAVAETAKNPIQIKSLLKSVHYK